VIVLPSSRVQVTVPFGDGAFMRRNSASSRVFR